MGGRVKEKNHFQQTSTFFLLLSGNEQMVINVTRGIYVIGMPAFSMLILVFFPFFQQEMNFFLHTNTNTTISTSTSPSPAPFPPYSILFYSILKLNMRRGLKIYAPVSAVVVELSLYSTINRAYSSVSSRCRIHFRTVVPFLVVSVSHTEFQLCYTAFRFKR